jgi:predicted PurR-regulated permease PerM/FixJ family two-component response regulator
VADADENSSQSWTQVRSVLRILGTVLGVLAGLWLVYSLAGVLALLVLSVFFAYVLAPGVALVESVPALRGRSWSRPVAILVVYLALFGSLTLLIYALAPRFSAQISDLGQRAPGYVEAARVRATTLTRVYRDYQLPPGVQTAVEEAAARAVAAVGDGVRRAVSTVLSWLQYLPWLFLIPILAFFFLKDADNLQRFAVNLLPEGRLRWRGRELIDEVNRTLALYVRVQIIAGLLIGFICCVGFTVLGVPYALLLGVLAGFLEAVPLVGPVIIALLAGFLASTNSAASFGLTILFLLLLRLVQDYVIYPRLVARGMKLHPAVIIVTLLCGAHLAGVAGLFLAIPAAGVLVVAYRYLLLQLGKESLLAALVPPETEQVTVAVQVATPTGVRALRPPVAALAGIRVAVVDNDEDVRTSLVELLRDAGATVFFAPTAAEALTLLEAKSPDVLLSDLAMPDQDGYDLIRTIRALPPERGGAIPAAAVSGYATEEDRARSLAAGFQQHLSKPVDPLELVAAVRTLARGARRDAPAPARAADPPATTPTSSAGTSGGKV